MTVLDWDCIIFDVDGTLWNSCESVCHSWGACLRERHGRKVLPSLSDISGIMGLTIEQIADRLLADFGEDRVAVMLDCMDWEIRHLYDEPGKLYPEVYDTLKRLAETKKLCIVSNCPDGYIQALLATTGLREFITDFECIGRTGMSKAENIRLVMERQGCVTAVYVGDMESDRQAARDADIDFIHALWGFGAPMPEETELESISGLLPV